MPQVGAPASAAGLRYDIQLTSTSSTTGNGTPSATSTTGLAHVEMANGNVRIDVATGQFAAMLGAGEFMIFRDTGHSALIFKPSLMQYVRVDLQKMSAGLTRSINSFSSAVGVKASDVKLNLASLGPGDSIGSLATSKYRLTEDYALSLSFMGRQSPSSKMHSTTDFWFTPNLSMVVNPFSRAIQETAWLGPDYGAQLAALQAQLPRPCRSRKSRPMWRPIAPVCAPCPPNLAAHEFRPRNHSQCGVQILPATPKCRAGRHRWHKRSAASSPGMEQ